MKKVISLILVLALCIPLCACSGDNAPIETTEPQPKEVSLGQKVTVGEYAFVITDVAFASGAKIRGKNFVPGDGKEFCIVSVTVYNNSRKECGLELAYFKLNYDNGYDTHGFRPSWSYGTSTYIVPSGIAPQQSESYVAYAAVPDLQVNDKTSSLVLEISFKQEEFQLKIH